MLGSGSTHTDFPGLLTDPYSLKRAKDALRSFRLVNHVCALAGERHLFREIILGNDYRHKPTNTLFRYLERLARRPQARFVQFVDLSRQEGWEDQFGPAILQHLNNSRGPEDKLSENPRFAEHWLIEILGSFSNLRRVVMIAPDEILGVIAKIDVPVRELDLRPNKPLSSIRISTGTTRSYSADTYALFEQLKCLRIHDLSTYVSRGKRSRYTARTEDLRHMISRHLMMARHLEHLMLSPWHVGSLSSIEVPDPPLNILTNLRILQFYGVLLHSSTLSDVLKSNATQLRSLEMFGVSLRSGYWEPVIDQIGAVIPTLTDLKLQRLGYDLPDPGYNGLGLSAPKQFGPLRTLRSADRAAWTRVLSTHSSVLCWEKSQYITERGLPLFNNTHARCTGFVHPPQAETPCPEASRIVCDVSGIWVHEADKSPLERVWLCKHHVDQRDDTENWPWGRPMFRDCHWEKQRTWPCSSRIRRGRGV